ncbi:hypothetical protein E2562_016133 [Oryza meyeriana var. granulata]|uniref:Uncharacterized protein n=1 Tax=Oryza meyeriana var. granulata TaxID=110450 RepID=A0A6G1F8L6_9ORYZ|nr:hypothetical protein E2562_016133 [Oryza meyeriana var. granulata]
MQGIEASLKIGIMVAGRCTYRSSRVLTAVSGAAAASPVVVLGSGTSMHPAEQLMIEHSSRDFFEIERSKPLPFSAEKWRRVFYKEVAEHNGQSLLLDYIYF